MANATIYGRSSTGDYLPIAVDSSGNLVTTGGTASLGAVTVTSGTVNIAGTVTTTGGGTTPVSGTVGVSGTVPVSGTVGVSGTVPVQTTNNGTVSVSNLPATQPISGTVGVSGTVPVSGNIGGTVLASNLPTTVDTNSGNKSASTLRVVLATDQPSLTNANPASQSGTWTVQPGNTQNTTPWLASPLLTAIDVTLTRPADTTTYTANDEISSSTSAPAVNTITSAARATGGYVRLRAAACVDSSSVATKAQLLVYIFDTTTTPNNDNAAFAPSDSVMNTCVGILPFNVWYPGDDTSGATGNAFSPYLGPELDIKTTSTANLFFRVKVLNAYVPTSAEAFVFRFTFVQY